MAIISGGVILAILLGYLLVILYKHAKTIPMEDFLKEVLITIVLISIIVFIISMWLLYPDVVEGLFGIVAIFLFFGLFMFGMLN